jgi:DNA polymerase-3 subunit gamma/tau
MKTMQDNSYKPWHLKYRPSKLEDLVGQPLVSRTLAQGIQTGKIANAYLFDGSRGTGKTSTARIVAKSLNCSSPDKPTATPCGKCTNCQTIETGNNIDVLELDAASNNGVDDIREIINYSQLSPAGNRYRVFIIDECHQLSRSAQQAFLRTLESPPNNVVFILATTEREKLLNTIISRCIHLRFSQITVNDIVTRLTHICKQEKVKIAEEALYAIARHSKGGMRDAIQLLEQLATSKTSEIKAENVQAVIGGITSEKLVLVTDSVLKGEINRLMKLSQEFADEGIEPANLRGEIEGEQFQEISELLELNPPATTIIFVTNLDRRTKVGKILISGAAIKQFQLIPQWKVQQLIQEVQSSSQKLGIKLPQQVAEYIVEAVGNDSARIAKELEKLAVCRGDRTITFKEVKTLIPSLNHSAIELAKAIKEHDALKINQLCLDLLAIGEHPLKITATLLTLFRTWLRLKAAIEAGIKSDQELQAIALVSNPNRLYFLKQEVQKTSTSQLSKIVIKLFEIECELKQGLNPESLSSCFLSLLK